MNKILTIKDKINELISNNLIIDDYDRLFYYIKNYNYNHVIAPYMALFSDRENIFKDDITSNEIINIYNFDLQISNIILKAILNIEKKLNTNIAYGILNDYRIFDYCLLKINKNKLENDVFAEMKKYWPNQTINQMIFKMTKYCHINTHSLIFENKSKNIPRTKWENCPLDAMCLSWSFSTTTMVFKSINFKTKIRILRNFSLTEKDLDAFITIFDNLLTIRNIISHNDMIFSHRLINFNQSVYELYEKIFDEKINGFSLLNLAKIMDYFNDSKNITYNEMKVAFDQLEISNKTKKILSDKIKF